MKKAVFLFVILAVATGCAPNARTKPAAEISQQMVVKDSTFDQNRSYIAPTIMGRDALGVSYAAHLIALQNKASGEFTHALSVNFSYIGNSWLFFNSASLPGGASPVTWVHDRNVSSCAGRTCSYQEAMSVAVPFDLIAKATSGLQIRFNSKGGFVIVDLPPNYILGYLTGIADKVK